MKEKILEIAIQEMKRGGYASLNFADIAAELNTSRANVHHHFKNKEGLAIAAAERYIEEYNAGFDKILRTHDGDIVTILQKVEQYLIDFVLESEPCGSCLCTQLVYETEAPQALRQLSLSEFRRQEEGIRAQVGKCREQGTLSSSGDVEVLTFRVMIAMYGIGQMALIESNKTKLINSIKGSLVSIVT